jgi:hypothetical protein
MLPHDLRAIARALGGNVSGGQVLAPGPGHSPKDRSLSIALEAAAPDGFVVNSFADDDWRTCRDHVRQRLGIVTDSWKTDTRAPQRPTPSMPERPVEQTASIQRIVRELVPVLSSPGKRYLGEERQIDTGPIADLFGSTHAIGWHPAVYFHEPSHPLHGQRLGCIVGVMTDPITAVRTGAISRTYLDGDLRKIRKAKTLGKGGGVVRLSRDEDVLGGLHIGEGIETCLAAATRYDMRPIWSTGSAAMLAQFPVLAGIEHLSIISDHDENCAGEHAARLTAERWLDQDREVRIIKPKTKGEDLSDVVKRKGGP